MKKKIVILLCLIFLLGCQKQEATPSGISPTTQDISSIEKMVKLSISEEEFHFVAGWLTDEEIAYVARDDEQYIVNSFHPETGKVKKLYEDDSIIVDVLIHPNGENLLVHTTNNAAAATIKIIDFAGVLLHEATIASSEIAIEWNSINPNIVLLTAFDEDWSFEVMTYEGTQNNMTTISSEDPFPKWLGESKVLSIENADDLVESNQLSIYDVNTETTHKRDMEKVSFIHTYKEQVLIGQAIQNDSLKYSLVTSDFAEIWSHEVPVHSNDLEWTFSDIQWLTDEEIIVATAKEHGQVEMTEGFDIVKMTSSGVQKIGENEGVSLRCQSSGEKCLTGFQLDKMMLTTEPGSFDWLQVES